MSLLKWRPARAFHDRGGRAVDWVVLHYTAGSFPGDYETLLKSPLPGQPSAHFYIRKNGDVYQMVRLENAAHHAGIVWSVPGSWQWKRWKALRPNERSVGIEIESAGSFTESQYAALAWLIPLLALRFDVPIALLPDPWRGHNAYGRSDAYEVEILAPFRGILGHGGVHFSKVDPGRNFDYDRIAALAVPATGPIDFADTIIWRGDPSQLPPEGIEYEDYL